MLLGSSRRTKDLQYNQGRINRGADGTWPQPHQVGPPGKVKKSFLLESFHEHWTEHIFVLSLLLE